MSRNTRQTVNADAPVAAVPTMEEMFAMVLASNNAIASGLNTLIEQSKGTPQAVPQPQLQENVFDAGLNPQIQPQAQPQQAAAPGTYSVTLDKLAGIPLERWQFLSGYGAAKDLPKVPYIQKGYTKKNGEVVPDRPGHKFQQTVGHPCTGYMRSIAAMASYWLKSHDDFSRMSPDQQKRLLDGSSKMLEAGIDIFGTGGQSAPQPQAATTGQVRGRRDSQPVPGITSRDAFLASLTPDQRAFIQSTATPQEVGEIAAPIPGPVGPVGASGLTAKEKKFLRDKVLAGLNSGKGKVYWWTELKPIAAKLGFTPGVNGKVSDEVAAQILKAAKVK